MTGAPRATPGAVDFDPRAPAFVADPAPVYHRLRGEAPVLYVPATESWWLTRYDDVLLALQDRRFGKEPVAPGGRPVTPVAAVGGESLPPSMLFRDPPEHTRLRALVNRAFTRGSWRRCARTSRGSPATCWTGSPRGAGWT